MLQWWADIEILIYRSDFLLQFEYYLISHRSLKWKKKNIGMWKRAFKWFKLTTWHSQHGIFMILSHTRNRWMNNEKKTDDKKKSFHDSGFPFEKSLENVNKHDWKLSHFYSFEIDTECK